MLLGSATKKHVLDSYGYQVLLGTLKHSAVDQ